MAGKPRLALLAAVVALALTACSGGGAVKARTGGNPAGAGSAAGPVNPARTEAADLRAQLSALLRADVNLTALTVQTAMASGFESEATQAAIEVMHHSGHAIVAEIAGAFTTQDEDFGLNEIERLRSHWEEYVRYVVDYIGAALASKETLKAEALGQLRVVEEELAADIADVTAKIVSVADAHGLLGGHTGLLTTTIDAIAERDPTAPEDILETAKSAQEMAKDLSRGLVLAPNEQIAFGGKAGAGGRIHGDAISGAAALRAELTGYLVQHVGQSLVMAHLVAEAGAESERTKAAIETLRANADELTGVIEDVYGTAAADDFARLYDEHVATLIDLAKRAATQEGAAATPAATDFPARLAALAGRISNGHVNERELEAALTEQVDAVHAAIETVAKGSTSAASEAEEAQAKAAKPAELLTAGMVEQFPRRFPAK